MYFGRAVTISIPNPPPEPPTVIPAHANYIFWQERINREGWWWAGWNTFRAPGTVKGGQNTPESVARGYGYYPFRNLTKNFPLEANGVVLSDNALVGPTLYLQNPLHQDVDQDAPKAPSGYDSDRRPYLDLGTQTTLAEPVSAGSNSITVSSTSGFAVDDEVFIDGGATNSEINEIATLGSSGVLVLKRDTKGYASGAPVKIVRELGGVRLNGGDLGVFGIMARNNSGGTASFYVQWVAVGT